jgi:AhpD family alkylhydroperoxidase
MRLNYAVIAPEPTKALAGVNAALLRAGLDKRLMDLLFLRVSQINGCSYCVDEHARDLRQAGESNERLDASPDGERAPTSRRLRKLRLTGLSRSPTSRRRTPRIPRMSR